MRVREGSGHASCWIMLHTMLRTYNRLGKIAQSQKHFAFLVSLCFFVTFLLCILFLLDYALVQTELSFISLVFCTAYFAVANKLISSLTEVLFK